MSPPAVLQALEPSYLSQVTALLNVRVRAWTSTSAVCGDALPVCARSASVTVACSTLALRGMSVVTSSKRNTARCVRPDESRPTDTPDVQSLVAELLPLTIVHAKVCGT